MCLHSNSWLIFKTIVLWNKEDVIVILESLTIYNNAKCTNGINISQSLTDRQSHWIMIDKRYQQFCTIKYILEHNLKSTGYD